MTMEKKLLSQALIDHRNGHADIAEPVYKKILADDPTCHEAWHLLGVVELQRGKADEAVRYIGEACRLEEKNSKYFNNLGNAFGQAGLIEEASNAFLKSHEIEPTFLDPLYNLGVTYHQNQEINKAEKLYLKILEINPDHSGANNNMGAIAKDRGQFSHAVNYFDKAIASDPLYVEALNNKGNIAEERGDVLAAVETFDLILSHKSLDSVRLKRNLLIPALYESVDEIDQVRKDFETNLDVLLNNPPSLSDPVRECSRAAFFLSYHGYNDRTLQEKISKLYRKACPNLNYTAPHCKNSLRTNSKIKIGFLSKYLCNHTIGKLNRGLIAKLSKDEFEITVFPMKNYENDDIAKFILDHADRIVPLAWRFEESVKRIENSEVDILYYTDIGMDPYSYFLAFNRLAPVQCVSWGHPVTTGIDTVDYFISAEPCETFGAQDHYSEELIKLDHVPTYYFPPDSTPQFDRAEFGFNYSDHLYVCAQSLFKVHPEMDVVFSEILDRDASAIIILISGNNDKWMDFLRRRFRESAGNNAERIKFVPRMTQEKFMGLIALADVLLDTFPFSGGNTSLEGFALGTPIVTLAGQYLRGRVTHAMYNQMGMQDGISKDKMDYVARAVRLATEPNHRAEVSSAILSRNKTLFENSNVIDDFASFFRWSLTKKKN